MKMLNYASALALVLGTVAVASGQVSPQTRAPLTPETKALHLLAKRPLSIATAKPNVSSSSDSGFNSAQGFGALARDQGEPGCDLFPAPANIGTNVGLSYFGPQPSTVNQSLVGPVQLLNTGQVDAIAGTITIPLYKGTVKSTGKTPDTSSLMFLIRGLPRS